MSFSLRALVVDDAPALHALGLAVARTWGGLSSDRVDATRKSIAERTPQMGLLLGAFDDEGLAGVVTLDGAQHLRGRHVARVSLAVRPERQGRGVGATLLRAAVDAADAWWGYVRLELGVQIDNAPAIALYEKFGFVRETLRRRDMLRDGQLVDGLGMARLRPGFVLPPEVSAPPPFAPRPEGTRAASRRIEGLRVRTVAASDTLGFARLHEQPSVLEGTFQLPYQTPTSWESRLANPAPGAHMFAAELEGRVVGSAGLFPLAPSPRFRHQAGFGISVHPDVQGRGIGDALLTAVLRLADDELGLARVQLEVYVDNLRGQALYAQHGFESEGVERWVALRRGTYVDAVRMSRLR